MLKENSKAPYFDLKDQDNGAHSLEDYAHKWFVAYFYPKDGSPSCIKEAINFKDNLSRFKEFDVEVLGISPDSTASHKTFSDKYGIPLTLLSDPQKEMIKKYHAKGIITKRISYLIGPGAEIKKAYPSVNPGNHAEEILNDLKTLKN